ncbi:MAG: hypothetical protein ONB24_15250 [candidate division KSB1 bacterium]|nr:hypothetical protein [candidate division KSB1 bacterium]
MVVLVLITGIGAIVLAVTGALLNIPELLMAGYIAGAVCGLLLAVTPLFVWAAVNDLRRRLDQSGAKSPPVKPVSRI